MKKWIPVIGLAALLCLTACQQEQQSTTQQSSSPISSSSSSQSSPQANSSSSSAAANQEPVFNGSYYTVEGKYGSVIIVNKKYPVSESYNPGENAEARAAFLTLLADMRASGYAVSDSYSGFRSYETQTTLYQNYVAQDGQEAADRYSARAGYSEHQTGLAFDILDTSGNLLTEETAVAWLKENAAQYGFIVRYPEGKEDVTGYMPESWHIRFIGQEAQEIAASGLTLEEYYGIQGGSYQE